eukprot:155396-Chlamydomonas_euryale.AAC.6
MQEWDCLRLWPSAAMHDPGLQPAMHACVKTHMHAYVPSPRPAAHHHSPASWPAHEDQRMLHASALHVGQIAFQGRVAAAGTTAMTRCVAWPLHTRLNAATGISNRPSESPLLLSLPSRPTGC